MSILQTTLLTIKSLDMKTLLTNGSIQLAIAVTLVACNPFRPSVTPSPLPDVLSSSPVVGSPSPIPIATGDPFTKGVDKAASATSLAQSAQSAEDWNLVLTQWQRAIAFMKAVPPSSPNHAAAQKLLAAYQRDLARAQQQAKRGSASQRSAAKGSADGGIPLIAGAQPSASPSPVNDAAAVAVTTINTLLQQQTEFFARQKRFAANLTELGGSIPADTPGYTYGTSVLPSKQVIATATAKQDNLPSYTGTFLLVKDDKNNDATVTAICLTSKPAKVPPAAPQVVNKEIQCPSGSSKL